MAKVINSFKDKTDGRIYYVGNDYAGDRLDELVELGYVEGEKATKPKATRRTKAAKEAEAEAETSED